MNLPIDKGMPLPPNPKKGLGYPFRDLEVGDSFLVPVTDDCSGRKLLRRVYGSVQNQQGKNGGRRFTCRTQKDGSVRVRRVS